MSNRRSHAEDKDKYDSQNPANQLRWAIGLPILSGGSPPGKTHNPTRRGPGRVNNQGYKP